MNENVTVEFVWAALKAKCFPHCLPKTRSHAKSMIFDYIETFYNPLRRHSSLGFLSPRAFEQLHSNN